MGLSNKSDFQNFAPARALSDRGDFQFWEHVIKPHFFRRVWTFIKSMRMRRTHTSSIRPHIAAGAVPQAVSGDPKSPANRIQGATNATAGARK